MLNKLLITILVCILLVGCGYSKKDTVDKKDNELYELLKDIGIDEETLRDETETKDGVKIIGGAKPAKGYSSLGLAEEAFGEYLGLHNKIESITTENYELDSIFIINNGEFLQAIYSNELEDKMITVKLSKKLSAEELAKVYYAKDKLRYTENNEMYEVKYKAYQENTESDIYNLAWFTTSNGKSYSIETKAGLNKAEFESLLDELIWNVTTMPNYEEQSNE